MNILIFAGLIIFAVLSAICCWICYELGKTTGIEIGREQERNSVTRRIVRMHRTRGFWISQN